LYLRLNALDWRERVPVHRASARPRLRVPSDRLSTAAQRQRRRMILATIRYWYAFPAPVDEEIVAAQSAWRRALTRPLTDPERSVNYLLWVPVGWQNGLFFPVMCWSYRTSHYFFPTKSDCKRLCTEPWGMRRSYSIRLTMSLGRLSGGISGGSPNRRS